ncbi:MAG TPA: hypothetical protein VNO30_13455 [Kofleriaceae bacterium]|nr:hypothetical protein [Kofleriaceae bacterium]
MVWLVNVGTRAPRVDRGADGQAARDQECLGLPDRVPAEMEDRGREHRVGAGFEADRQVGELAATARGDCLV